MNVLLHGATSFRATNFGDFLFCDMFFDRAARAIKKGSVRFLSVSDFFYEHFQHKHLVGSFNLLRTDALVYIAGGYFGQSRNENLRATVKRLVRYMPVGLLMALLRRPYAIVGVGAGPLTNRLLRAVARFIFNRARLIVVRDEESRDYLVDYGVNNGCRIIVTTDAAQVIDADILPPLPDRIRDELSLLFGDRKLIFVHVSPRNNEAFRSKLLGPINTFLQSRPDFGVVVGCDEFSAKQDEQLKSIADQIASDHVMTHRYDDPWELCALLNRMDMIVTTKLHVGVVGAALGKAVVSFPEHPEKTERYYRQIGQPHRCCRLDSVTPQRVLEMLTDCGREGIVLTDSIRRKAEENFQRLEEFLASLEACG